MVVPSGMQKLLEFAVRIAQIPPADIDRLVRRVVQFDRVAAGRVGVGQNLVDDHVATTPLTGRTGGSAVFGAGPPIGRIAVIAGNVEDFE